MKLNEQDIHELLSHTFQSAYHKLKEKYKKDCEKNHILFEEFNLFLHQSMNDIIEETKSSRKSSKRRTKTAYHSFLKIKFQEYRETYGDKKINMCTCIPIFVEEWRNLTDAQKELYKPIKDD